MSILDNVNGVVNSLNSNTEDSGMTGKGAYGKLLGGLLKKGQVMGMPPRFTGLADPHDRVYMAMTTPPPIVSITPGSPQPTQLDKEQIALAGNLLTRWSETNPETNQAIMSEIRLKLDEKAKKDARGVTFNPTPGEYYRVLQVIMSRLGSRFASTAFSLPTSTEMSQFGSLMFYLDKGTSFTESGSNQYDDSLFSSLYKTASSISNEAQDIASQMGIATQAEAIAKRQNAILDSFNKQEQGDTGAWANLGMALQGDTVLFPKTWKGAGFNRSYSLSFKFETPYGDRASVFRDVYTPFAACLSLVLPKQTSISSFTAPFLVRVDCPGMFTIDLGSITSFSFRKSTDHLTYGGYTRCIEVSMEIEDMYPALMASPDFFSLGCNFGLAYYLDNLAVVDYTHSGSYASLAERVSGAASNMALGVSGLDDVAYSKLKGSFAAADPLRYMFGRL